MEPIGIVGMGALGASLAARADAAGHPLIAYDVRAQLCEAHRAANDLAELCAAAACLLVAVPASAAPDAAAGIAEHLRADVPYLDWSSSTPDEKRGMAAVVGIERFVDVALLDSITSQVPFVCISGQRLQDAHRLLAQLGFDVHEVGSQPGLAAVSKMVRSMFMKPFEMLAIELLRAAHATGTQVAVASVERTLGEPFPSLAAMLLETNRRHASRRAAELADARSTVAPERLAPALDALCVEILELDRAWSRPDAPPAGAEAGVLLEFLASLDAGDA